MLYLIALPCCLLVVVYCGWQLHNIHSFRRLIAAPVNRQSTPLRVAVVIPFRDELPHLHTLVRSLLIQDFPKGQIELLFVDDHSTDGGRDYLADVLRESGVFIAPRAGAGEGTGPDGPRWTVGPDFNFNVRILNLKDYLRGRPTAAHKKAALAYGVASTSADVIVTTDADCRLDPRLLSSIVSRFRPEVAVVSGPVFNAPLTGLCDHFQALDLTAYQFLTAVSLERGTPVLANGACFAFRRSAFVRVGGYAGVDHLPSGDDVLLLHKFRQVYPADAFRWLVDGPVTDTAPVGGWTALWRQRLRWAGKAGHYRAPELTFAQGLTFLCCAALILLLPLSLHLRAGALLLPWLLKAAVDGFALRTMLRHYHRPDQFRFYPLISLIYPFFLVAVGTAALLGRKSAWKGRAA